MEWMIFRADNMESIILIILQVNRLEFTSKYKTKYEKLKIVLRNWNEVNIKFDVQNSENKSMKKVTFQTVFKGLE